MKNAGLIFIVLSCTFMGIYLSNQKKRTIRYIEGALYLIRHIRYKITYFRSEIDKIYLDFSNDFFYETGIYNELAENDLKAIFDKYNPIYAVREYESNAMKDLASTLGRSSWEDQTDKCSRVIDMLENYLDEMNMKYPEEKKFISSIGIISGLLIAVVLL